jgi:hypothetical protein
MSTSSGLYPPLDSRNANKLQLQLHNITIKKGYTSITNPQTIADSFNKFFIDIVEDLLLQRNKYGTKCKPKYQTQRCSKIMFVAPVTEMEMERVIASLNKDISAGCDEIPMLLIKQCMGYIIKPLVRICSVSFKYGIFPDQMKIAKIKPLFKKGDKQNMLNYRPISVLSVFSKILEKLMYNRLLSFLKQHHILTEVQHGFRENKSTETASQSFIESVQEALDNQSKAIGIFLDLSKAYDVINHETLLDKLDSYGVRGITNN